MATRYKNIVGSAFLPYVKRQFFARKKANNKYTRSNAEIQYLTNKNAWFRLSSSSETTDSPTPTPEIAATTDPRSEIFAGGIGATQTFENNATALKEAEKSNADQLKRFNNSFTSDSAKDNVLQGGIVKAGDKNSTTLRKGFKNTYSKGPTDDLGLRPMPGITGITVGTGGKWQTLMQADIEFICYDLDQLNEMSKLYMSLGVTCFLEWGHVPYLDNSGKLKMQNTNLDFFKKGLTKDQLIKNIAKKRAEANGNYDAFLGTVYNFSYQGDKDGAYLCKTQLMGAGGMVESLKINTSFNVDFTIPTKDNKSDDYLCSLDNALASMSQYLISTDIYKTSKRKKKGYGPFSSEFEVAGTFGKISNENFSKIKKIDTGILKNGKKIFYESSWSDLLNNIYKSSAYTPFSFSTDEKSKITYNKEFAKRGNAHQIVSGIIDGSDGLDEIPLDFYTGYAGLYKGGGESSWRREDDDYQTYITFGHLLALLNSVGIFVESTKPILDTNVSPILYIDYHPDNTEMDLAPVTATINPYKCLVPFSANKPYQDFFKGLDINGDDKYWFQKASETEGTKVHNLSNEKIQNKINKTYPSSEFKNKNGTGKLMKVLINIDFARGELRNSLDSENNINLIEYVNKLLDGINLSLGGVNNFRTFIDECGSILRIVDEKVLNPPTVKEELVEIPTFGVSSIAYDASYSSAITPKLAAQIVIATQGAGGKGIQDFSEDVLSYQSLNAGVKDKFSSYKFPAIVNKETDVKDDQAKKLKSLIKLYNHLFYVYTTENPTITPLDCSNLTSSYIDRSNQSSKTEASNDPNQNPNKSSVLIPLEYTVKIDGIGGILPYNAFTIPNNRLPERYRNKVAFAVFSINHSFEDNNWFTTLRGQTLMLDTVKTLSNNKLETPKTEVTIENNPQNQSNSPRGVSEEYSNEGKIPNFSNPITDDIELTVPFTAQNENNTSLEIYEPYQDNTYTTNEENETSVSKTLRIGYGTETITRGGQVRRVQEGDQITKEEAIDDLKRILKDVTKPFVVKELNKRGVNFEKLQPKVQVVILDIAYNYGGDHKTLYSTFLTAIQKDSITNSTGALIQELERRAAMGAGQVPSRRQNEINYLRG